MNMKIRLQVWGDKGILCPGGMRGSPLHGQQDKQLTWLLIFPISPIICDPCSGVLKLGQNKWEEKKKKSNKFWDRGIKQKYFSRHFFFSLAATGHCSQVWYFRHGPRGDCPVQKLQVRQPGLSPPQAWFPFAVYMVFICSHHAKHR